MDERELRRQGKDPATLKDHCVEPEALDELSKALDALYAVLNSVGWQANAAQTDARSILRKHGRLL